MNTGKITLILGGANSGKSRFAEDMVVADGRPRTYIATAQAFDDEMREKIKLHQMARAAGWETLEIPMDLADALPRLSGDGVVLIDCLTMWLSNQILADHDAENACNKLLEALQTCPADVVCVSNEVGLSIVPDTALGRRFRASQGRLNQAVAAQAGLVVMVTAGLPMVLKGSLS